MSFDMELPNGFVMTGIPDGTSEADIAKHAVQKGYAKPEDFIDFPEAYRAAGGKTHDAGNLGRIEQQGEELNNTWMGKAEHIINEIGGSLVMPEFAGGSLAARLGLEAGSQAAVAGAQAAADNQPVLPAAALGAASVPAAHAVGAVVKPLTARFAPSIAAYLKGWFDTVPAKAEENAPVIVEHTPTDEAPIPAEESTVQEVKSGWDEAMSKDAVKKEAAKGEPAAEAAASMQARQDAWRQDANDIFIRRLSALEATSYFASQLKREGTGKVGTSFADALQNYRAFTGSYHTTAVPHPAMSEDYWHLAETPFYEAVLRRDVPELDEMITQSDMGHIVNPQEALDALKGYEVKMQAVVDDFMRSAPPVLLTDLRRAAELTPEIGTWADIMGVLNPASAEKLTGRALLANRAGAADAMKPAAEQVAATIEREIRATMEELRTTPATLPNVITALKNKIQSLKSMQADVLRFSEKGDAAFAGLRPNDEAIYEAMALTHTGTRAPEGMKALNDYRALRAASRAMPAERPATALDNVLSGAGGRTGAAVAGALMGGLPGALGASVAREAVAVAGKAGRAMRRRRRNAAAIDAIVEKSHNPKG